MASIAMVYATFALLSLVNGGMAAAVGGFGDAFAGALGGALADAGNAVGDGGNAMGAMFGAGAGNANAPGDLVNGLMGAAVQLAGCGDHGIECCPKFTVGDNIKGEEKFVPESDYNQNCLLTCSAKYPETAVGITESKTETYPGNKKPKCWCEFGQPKLNNDANYQTCLSPNAVKYKKV